jgi:hypothetical protein
MGGVFTKPVKMAQGMGIITPGQKYAQNIASGGNPATALAAGLSPTTAEVSQSSATDADGSSTSVKTKRKGRSATILTSSAGVEGDATLGKKSLLGE